MEMTDWQGRAWDKAKAWQSLAKQFLAREYSHRALALLFLGALLSGAALKALVNDVVTIGFDDYTLSHDARIVDLNALQEELVKNGGTLATSEESAAPRGESCSLESGK